MIWIITKRIWLLIARFTPYVFYILSIYSYTYLYMYRSFVRIKSFPSSCNLLCHIMCNTCRNLLFDTLHVRNCCWINCIIWKFFQKLLPLILSTCFQNARKSEQIHRLYEINSQELLYVRKINLVKMRAFSLLFSCYAFLSVFDNDKRFIFLRILNIHVVISSFNIKIYQYFL